ncbi:MAG: DUF1844 domain-containing protein [Myxococcales bacterium]
MERKPGLDFNAFVLSLGSSALIHLGEAPDPESGKTQEPDLALAQGSIDLLALLEEKTKGNLTPDESRFLQTMLYDLRMRFVSAKAHPKAKITPPPAEGERK